MKWEVKTNIFLTYFLPKNMSRRGRGGRFFNRRDDSMRDFERHYSSRDEGSNGNWGNYDGSEAGSSFMGQGRGRGRGGRGGHPSGLKGKDIGMWYRQKSLQNKKKEEEKFDLRLAVNLDPRRHQQIEDLLCSIRTPYLCGARKDISKSNIFSDTLRTKGEFVKKSGTKESERLDKFSGERSNNTKVPDNWDDVMEDSEACKPNLSSVSVPGASENWETTSIKYSHIGESEFKRKFLQNITGSIGSKMDNSLFMTSVLAKDSKLDEILKERLQAKQENSTRYNQMLEFRKKLPSFQMRQDILHMVRENQVILISGETGCGKTTQVAQFILDDYILRGEGSTCHVVCTQPRRISATSVAERVASERDEVCGADSTGYQIRLEAKICRKKGSILFCTTGILLQWMRSDPALREVSHLVLDEIHERDVTSDFVITILKDVIPKRPNLKVILMSATLNAEQFSKYYDNCPSINIPGFTYPVEELYLEDVLHLTNFTAFKPPRQEQGWKKHMPQNKSKLRKVDEFKDFIEPYVRHLQSQKNYSSRVLECLKNPNSEDICLELVEALLHHICSTKEDGAILVFLPGWADISSLHNIITNSGRYPLSRYTVIPLHSMMPTTTQKSVFDRPPRGVRKIVLATNIAETSITIDDVVYVVDCGKIKMKNFDVENNIATLKSEWVSLANARQRKGRAGRVQPGVCYHLYTRAREMTLENYPLPEMLRSRLEEVILQLKILQLGQAEPFLQRVMDPPDPRVLEISLKLLHTLNALDSDENLTPLGYHLANLPLDPQTGKMILMGAMFSCIDPIFSVAASLTFKDPFVIPLGKEDQVNKCKIELSNGSKSDHLVIAEAVKLWEQAKTHGHSRDFCWDYFLSQNTLNLLKDMKEQFARYLYDMNFLSEQDVKAPTSNVNSNNLSLVKAIICAGLYPNIAIIKSVKRRNHTGKVIIKLSTPEDGRVELHPKSINEKMSDFESRFLLYHLKLKSTAIFLHDTTMVYPLPLLFFGEGIDYYEENGTEFIAVNNSIRFKCRKSTSSLVKDLRNRLDGLLEHKVTHPGVIDWSRTSEEGALLRAIIELITYEDKQLMIAQEIDDDNFSN